MTYYPKSQIKTGLYTEGGEYYLSSTREDYVGPYYEISSGKKFSGKSPESSPTILLITSFDRDFQPNSDAIKYNQVPYTNKSITLVNSSIVQDTNNLTPNYKRPLFNPPIKFSQYSADSQKNHPLGRSLPSSNLTLPTSKDYEIGKYIRYFTKKNNENRYFEIDKESSQKLKSKQEDIAWDLYSSIFIIWTLTGERDEVYLTNKNIIALAETKNKYYGFTQWFKDDFLKYYQNLDIQEDLFTDGTEFINRRTKLAYRGPYHIHPEKGPMVGAKHIQREHDYLDPIQPTPDLIVDPTPIPTPTYSSGGGSTSSGGGGYSGGSGGY